MTVENRLSASKRRTRAEVQQLVAEFISSGMRRSEFCQSRGLSFSTLDRHLKKRQWRKKTRSAPAAGKLGAAGVAREKPAAEQQASCGRAVVLSSGRRIEVQRDFDVHTFERLVGALERV